MDRSQIVVLVAFVIAATASVSTTRISKKKENIYGGLFAEVFHYLGVIAYLAVLPAALLGSLFVGPFKLGIPLALACLGVALLLFIGYAFVERSARVGLILEDRGWTEEDARSSGL